MIQNQKSEVVRHHANPTQAAGIGVALLKNGVDIIDPGTKPEQRQTMLIAGYVCDTSLPFNPFMGDSAFHEKSQPGNGGLATAALDIPKLEDLPTGTYRASTEQMEYYNDAGMINTFHASDSYEEIGKRIVERQITIVETPVGKAVTRNSFARWPGSVYTGREVGLLKAQSWVADLGFVTEGEGDKTRIEAIPLPETFKRRAADVFGVDVRLISDGKIDAKTYVQAFADGTYPVGTGANFYYGHDTDPTDHVMGVFLGGKVLRDALAEAAKSALVVGDKLGFMAQGIDIFTTRLTELVLGQNNSDPADIKPDSNSNFNLYTCGHVYFGFDEITVKNIIENTLMNAHAAGLAVGQAKIKR